MEIEQLRGATVRELRARYFELFGQPSRSNHKQFLFRRVAWRLQALAYGDLSDEARRQALALAQDADLRIKARPQLVGAPPQVLQPTLESRRKPGRDERLPEPGSILHREFKGQIVVVQVVKHGFQYQDRFYKSLSAIARQITGTHWNVLPSLDGRRPMVGVIDLPPGYARRSLVPPMRTILRLHPNFPVSVVLQFVRGVDELGK